MNDQILYETTLYFSEMRVLTDISEFVSACTAIRMDRGGQRLQSGSGARCCKLLLSEEVNKRMREVVGIDQNMLIR